MDVRTWTGTARTRGRREAARRAHELRVRLWAVVQCAVGAAVAYWIAASVLGHTFAIFAPIVAIVCLGVTYGDRHSRVVQVMLGAAIGVGLAELFAIVFGRGIWQMAVAVTLAMTVAVLLDAGVLLVTQAAVQTSFVTLVEPFDGGLARVEDALVGGVVALVVTAVAPGQPIRKPRELAVDLVRELGTLFGLARECALHRDPDAAAEALDRARATDALVQQVRGAAAEGLDVVAQSPLRRRDAPIVRKIVDVVTPLDHALRDTRVLIRRLYIAARRDDIELPDDYVELMRGIEKAAYAIADALEDERSPGPVRPRLRELAGHSTTALAPATLSNAVILGQLRSVLIDLMQLTGLSYDEAITAIPHR